MNLDLPKSEEPPQLVWSGHPVEIDGDALGATGAILEVHQDPNSPDGFHYRVSNGCNASGLVTDDGQVSPSENFQPCRAEDIALIGRILVIAPPGLPGPDQPARLVWDRETATLSSIRGEVRFKSDGRLRAAPVPNASRQ